MPSARKRAYCSTRAVPDDPRSPLQHHLVLDRIDPVQGIWCFYPLMIERDLSGTVRLVRGRQQRAGMRRDLRR